MEGQTVDFVRRHIGYGEEGWGYLRRRRRERMRRILLGDEVGWSTGEGAGRV
jgi:hypothetical protein